MQALGYAKHWEAVAEFFAAHGAVLLLDPEGPNQIAAYREDLPGLRPAWLRRGDYGDKTLKWAIQVQGWVNLVHEVAHILQAGRLDEDSGFEYARVPLRLDRARDRAYLFDELCACALSCDFYAEYPDPPESVRSQAHRLEPSPGLGSGLGSDLCDESRRKLWFAEQVDILPVFYGLEERSRAEFVTTIQDCLRDYAAEMNFAEGRAYDRWARFWRGMSQDLQPGISAGRQRQDAELQDLFSGISTVELLAGIKPSVQQEGAMPDLGGGASGAEDVGLEGSASRIWHYWRGYAADVLAEVPASEDG